MRKSSRISAARSFFAITLLMLFSCSIPFFGKGRTSSEENVQKLSTVVGVLDFQDGCNPGYYQVILKGLFESADIQIETQTDSLGKFTVTAPPGQYLAQINKENCGTKLTLNLENNTEHMFSFVIQETRLIEKVGNLAPSFPARLPASVLISIGQ